VVLNRRAIPVIVAAFVFAMTESCGTAKKDNKLPESAQAILESADEPGEK